MKTKIIKRKVIPIISISDISNLVSILDFNSARVNNLDGLMAYTERAKSSLTGISSFFNCSCFLIKVVDC